jgi:hypothetical protein
MRAVPRRQVPVLAAALAMACGGLQPQPAVGGAPYRYLEDFADDLDPGGSFVEIGSDRGEGSTAWLHSFAARTGRDFFSVDFAPEGYENARRVCGSCAHRGLGEDFLSSEFRAVSRFGNISFAYLDNYDWIWAGEHPESYTMQFPAMMRDEEMSAYKLKMRKEYEAEGFELNNGRSQAAHLAQAKLVYSLCTARCIIIFDDTFQLGNGLYSGKGGAAMRFLLADERFEVVTQSSIEQPSYNGFVVVRRLPGTSPPTDNENEEAATGGDGGGEEAERAPVIIWKSPAPGAVVPCCKVTVSLAVRGAVNSLQHLVFFINHLERFRRAEWSNDEIGGQLEDTVSFDLPADGLPHTADGRRNVLLSAHMLSIKRLQVFANTSLHFDFARTDEL